MSSVERLSKHERLSDAPFDKHVLSVPFVLRQAQDERQVEGLRVNGNRLSEKHRGRRRVSHGYVFSIMDSLVYSIRRRGPKKLRSDSPGEWRRGTSPLRSLRTGLEPLGSSGSHHPAVGLTPICQCGKSPGCLWAILPNQYTALVRWYLNLFNFLLAHRTKILFRCRKVGYIADL